MVASHMYQRTLDPTGGVRMPSSGNDPIRPFAFPESRRSNLYVKYEGETARRCSAHRLHGEVIRLRLPAACTCQPRALISTSTCSSQNRMSISRYIVVAVVKCPPVCSQGRGRRLSRLRRPRPRLLAAVPRRLWPRQTRRLLLQATRRLSLMRRMAQSAVHLVDHVISRVPVRPWVLSFPIPLRLLVAPRAAAHPLVITLQAPRAAPKGFRDCSSSPRPSPSGASLTRHSSGRTVMLICFFLRLYRKASSSSRRSARHRDATPFRVETTILGGGRPCQST
jgi:hypothetical protein